MIGLIALLFLLIACVRLIVKVLLRYKEIIFFNIEKKYVVLYLFSVTLYIVPILFLLVPGTRNSLLNFFHPIPFHLLLFIPGIVYSRLMEKKFETMGIDRAINLAKIFSDTMWVGLGIFLVFVVMSIWWHMTGVSDQLPIVIVP